MSIQNEHDLLALQRIGRIVAEAREAMLKAVRAGITTKELDRIGGDILAKYGARSAPQVTYDFPGQTCISVNHVVAHGIPDGTVLKEGDVVNVDVSAELDGYFADTGASVVVGQGEPVKQALCKCAEESLYKALDSAKAGSKLSQIGRIVHNEAKAKGFTVVKNLTGHGIGKSLHEEPAHVLNYYDKWDKRLLTDGLVLAVETFISTGTEYVKDGADGWAWVTPDRSYVAQYEHTVVITRGKPIILTA
ncbi:type I methionyl aminopeptidase [Brevibacillus agri]|uniref:type I methionyl aminopeptidase n=1 Tax=Brevibacillus TaxID=55080 RepID=UPI0003FAE547|nr:MULTISPECIES: type I methionyl aminopeptidase [Brevibacillus]MED1645363.1 type I methionyl aminopeptidase [Brevibacillus agri]MED1655246.1 type I methionyl aminopeptidase [Brevibacillus agri]MED1687188.1 type I methionyl aminopeptidase [Brevibacillus agri]MED1693307.1 type I methionyl aminopeptidase [Brevibacillus agri]MED1699443.1 type I methionyl aminopeptidase [Brevibacillus agri]